MNTVTVFDEYHLDKGYIFGAYQELHKLAITQIVLGTFGMAVSFIYWLLPRIGINLCLWGMVCLKVSVVLKL